MSKRVLKPLPEKRRVRVEKNAVTGPNSKAHKVLSPSNDAYSYLMYTTVQVNKNAFLKKRKMKAVIPYDYTTQSSQKRRRRRAISNIEVGSVVTLSPSAPPAFALKTGTKMKAGNKFAALFQMFDNALSDELENFQSKTNKAVNKISERLSKVYVQYKYAVSRRRNNNGHKNKNHRAAATPLLIGKVVRVSKTASRSICIGSSV